MLPNRPATFPSAISAGFLLAISGATFAEGAGDRVLSDDFSPRSGKASTLLRELHRMGSDDSSSLGHIEPSRDSAVSSGRCLEILDRDSSQRLSVHCLGGIQSVILEDRSAQGVDLGLRVAGNAALFGFDLDARIFVQRQSPRPFSYDGQYIETQTEGPNSRADYTSFSRFEGTTTWDSPLGHLAAGRGRQHWGPAYEYPLSLGQWTNPYTLMTWSLSVGDLQVRTLWADLSIDGAGSFRSDSSSRALYGHRYEWRPAPWIVLGASELLLLHDHQEPIAFLPFIPLFMLKGQTDENRNNGELSFDLDVRVHRGVRVYGEFLVDDMSEPTSLFNDLWKNRWAATGGVHLSREVSRDLATGLICEYSHVEPWVYTHYVASTVQPTHQGIPLGNVNGPNSRSVSTRGYLWWKELTLGARFEAVWKGLDDGSRWTDTLSDNNTTTKRFLGGGVARNLEGTLDAGWSRGPYSASLGATWPIEDADLERVRVPARLLARLETCW